MEMESVVVIIGPWMGHGLSSSMSNDDEGLRQIGKPRATDFFTSQILPR